MVMPDAVDALLRLADADRGRITRCAYNLSAFSPTAEAIRNVVIKAFPGAEIRYSADARRQAIVDSGPAEVDDSAARGDWGFAPRYDFTRAFDDYTDPDHPRTLPLTSKIAMTEHPPRSQRSQSRDASVVAVVDDMNTDDAFRNRFVIPSDRLDRVFTAAIDACRTRTLAHIALPPEAVHRGVRHQQELERLQLVPGSYRSVI